MASAFDVSLVRTQGAYVFIFKSRSFFFVLFGYLPSFPLLFFGFVILMLTFVSITWIRRKLFDRRTHNTLQHTATYCNTLQHTATHCNTLQHTATHCNLMTPLYVPPSAHGEDQTKYIWISTSIGFPDKSFEWQGLRLHTWKLAWKSGDSRENVFDMYGDSRVNSLEILTVVMILSPISLASLTPHVCQGDRT